MDTEQINKADQLYTQGREAWRNGERAKAMTLLAESAELNPDGPAVEALSMLREIMNFYDPNQLNP